MPACYSVALGLGHIPSHPRLGDIPSLNETRPPQRKEGVAKPPDHIKSIVMHRYLVQFDSAKLPRIDTDFLVIGDGSAGVTAAIEASQHGDVLLITKRTKEERNLPYPHVGIAANTDKDATVATHIERRSK